MPGMKFTIISELRPLRALHAQVRGVCEPALLGTEASPAMDMAGSAAAGG